VRSLLPCCVALLVLLLAACDVPPPPPSTGGVQIDDGACGRGLVVIGSNYGASNVALMDHRGVVRSSSVLSSGAAAAGVSLPLSGDVVAPTERPSSGEVVLLDRFPNAVLTWLNPTTGGVRAQLSVATGFPSNPQDYLEITPEKAYVPRQNTAPAPGSEPHDGGGDLLILDPRVPSITGRIPLDVPAPYLPRPARLLHVGNAVWTLLLRMDADFQKALDGAIVAIDPGTDTPRWTAEIPGLANCGILTPSPDKTRIAVACSGVFAEGAAAQLARSGVVLLEASDQAPPRELARIPGSSLGAAPSFASMAFADDDHLLVPLYGDLDQQRPDRLIEITLSSGAVRAIHEATTAFKLGDVRCGAPCSPDCFLADAEAQGVRLLKSTGGAWSSSLIPVAPELGLPPRNLGGF
jgi:hypothetical protein